jgi:hypothetical protein
MIHLHPPVVYAALALVAGILAGKWLEQHKGRQDSVCAPVAGKVTVCPNCGAKIAPPPAREA